MAEQNSVGPTDKRVTHKQKRAKMEAWCLEVDAVLLEDEKNRADAAQALLDLPDEPEIAA